MFAILWAGRGPRVIGPFPSETGARAYITGDPDLEGNANVCVLPLDAPAAPTPSKTPDEEGPCGCYAGILIMNGSEIQRCDDCKVVASDDDAIATVRALLVRRAEEPVF